MFAAIPLALKIGGPLVILGLLSGLVYSCKESLRNEGEARLAIEHLQQSEEQRKKESDRYREKEQSRLEIVEKTAEERNAANALLLQAKRRSEQLQQKVRTLETKEPEVRYETAYVEVEKVVEKPVPVCMYDPRQLERLSDSIGVFNHTIASYRDEGASGAAEEPALQAPPTITCADIPDLTNEVIARLINTSIDHRGLSKYVADQYNKDRAAKEEDQ